MTSQLIGTSTHIQLIHISHALLNAVRPQSNDDSRTCVRKQGSTVDDLCQQVLVPTRSSKRYLIGGPEHAKITCLRKQAQER